MTRLNVLSPQDIGLRFVGWFWRQAFSCSL